MGRLEMIKFVGRLFGHKRYQVFVEIDNECWRQFKRDGMKGFIFFKNACKKANNLKKSSLSWGLDDEYFVVAIDRSSDPLYKV
jgi:hypothetical protein